MSFFISKNGKINPTKEEALSEAPEASNNWVRLGLGKVTSIGLPVWFVLAFPIIIWSLSFGSDVIVFGIENIFSAIILSLSFSLDEYSFLILALNSVKNALIFIFGTLSKFLAICLFAWVLNRIWKSFK